MFTKRREQIHGDGANPRAKSSSSTHRGSLKYQAFVFHLAKQSHQDGE